MLPNDSPLVAMSVADDHDEDSLGVADTDTPSPEIAKGIPEPPSRARESDVISVISEANSFKSSKSKKRVQFLPEGLMVRVREIPPRSNKSSESDGSASETSSESEGSDTESEETSSAGSRTPSPAHTVSDTTFTTMPPLVWNPSAAAKGSYTLAKPTTKTVSTVAKITGIHPRPVQTSTSSSSYAVSKNSPRRLRRTPSPKLEKRAKKTSPKPAEKTAVSVSVKSLDPPLKSKPVRKSQLRKDGKISPPASSQKQNNKGKQPSANNTSNNLKLSAMATKVTLAQRRINSAPTTKLIPPKRSSYPPSKSTSVSLLPAHQTSNQHAASGASMDKVGRAMQSLTMGQLYTIDGFIFPSHQAPEVHLPDVLAPYKSEDLGAGHSLPSRLSSPRRSLDYGSIPLHHGHHSQQGQTSPTSATRKKRHAWQMAEGGVQSTLNNTPSIAQLWDHGTAGGAIHDTASGGPGRPLSNGYAHRI